MSQIPRPEYPRPILVRENWQNLNGCWSFQADPQDQGLNEGWYIEPDFTDSIVVPFPIESEASGQYDLQPAKVNWYSRSFQIDSSWQPHTRNSQILLHLGACDHWTRIFVNGIEVGQHRGGYTPISLDITHALNPLDNQLTIRVEDSLAWTQPRGKQAGTTRWPIDYDSVTGIWQTVWLEPVSSTHVTALHSQFDCRQRILKCWVETNRQNELTAEVHLLDGDQLIAQANADFGSRAEAKLELHSGDARWWSHDSPHLLTLKILLRDSEGITVDQIESYVGLREIGRRDGAITINDEPLYLRGVLDQGYYPEGWYTAMDDGAIKADVELTLAMGFNCARKHQKIEDPRYLYWADRLGLLVWAEMPSGRVFSNELIRTLTDEWLAVIQRDRQHPCIIAWVPFNESWGVWHQAHRPEQRAFVDAIVALTRATDSSRLIVGNDGWEYSSGDLWTLHLYEGDADLSQRLNELLATPTAAVNDQSGSVQARNGALPGASVTGLPVLLTECGGIGFTQSEQADDVFAYGELPNSQAELAERLNEVAQRIDAAPQLAGFVWTQLTDVAQEINGLLYFDRTPKLPISEIHALITSTGNPND